MKNLYDCHVHLNLSHYDNNREQIINKCKKELDFVINIGIDEESSEKSILYSYKYDFIYASIGIHPTNISEFNNKLERRLLEMGKEQKVVAIGEIGLDYHWMEDPKKRQIEVFEKQMKIAEKLNKPVIIHNRDADKDTLNVLEKFENRVKGVMHTYAGGIKMMEKLNKMGYYFSFSGPVTFKGKRSEFTRDVIKKTPIERILIETDSPFLTPHPFRGKVNTPINVDYVASKIAEIKNIKKSNFLNIVRKNAEDIFGI